eukprot:GILK01005249.1.p1 GENE.GILK01005249.1~~GILK01005249.1.p1  ORF type:complete len:318 (-),score=60.08 GILK01005249.1:177-1097(-)
MSTDDCVQDDGASSFSLPDVASLRACLVDRNAPLAKRMRAIFYLRSINGPEAVEAISAAFEDPSDLLKHELAYVLGQMQHMSAVPVLTRVLEDQQQAPIVRHEAAEALGALGQKESIEVIERYATDPAREVAETCEIALKRLRWKHGLDGGDESFEDGPYMSVDPAPAMKWKSTSVESLKQKLLDTSSSLYERYRAMFALRNKGDQEAVLALAEGFEDESALFRHEIAYVMGQLQHPASIPALTKVLINSAEQGMVRHEAAEALGSIGHPESIQLLEQYKLDSAPVVSESCVVALDIADYWGSNDL